jgi:hypothetical protein
MNNMKLSKKLIVVIIMLSFVSSEFIEFHIGTRIYHEANMYKVLTLDDKGGQHCTIKETTHKYTAASSINTQEVSKTTKEDPEALPAEEEEPMKPINCSVQVDVNYQSVDYSSLGKNKYNLDIKVTTDDETKNYEFNVDYNNIASLYLVLFDSRRYKLENLTFKDIGNGQGGVLSYTDTTKLHERIAHIPILATLATGIVTNFVKGEAVERTALSLGNFAVEEQIAKLKIKINRQFEEETIKSAVSSSLVTFKLYFVNRDKFRSFFRRVFGNNYEDIVTSVYNEFKGLWKESEAELRQRMKRVLPDGDYGLKKNKHRHK